MSQVVMQDRALRGPVTDVALTDPSRGRYHRPGWVRRRRTAGALLTVVALIAGLAVAFKMFEQTVPNNVVRDAAAFNFSVQVQNETGQFVTAGAPPQGRPIYEATYASGPNQGQDINTFPGDTRVAIVRVSHEQVLAGDSNTGFKVYIDQASIVVCRPRQSSTEPSSAACLTAAGSNAPVLVTTADADRAVFLRYWTLRVEAHRRLFGSQPAPEAFGEMKWGPACAEQQITAITRASPCNLGWLKKQGQPNSSRDFRFTVKEADEGDQSRFKGWAVGFSFVFQAQVPYPGGDVADS